MIFTLSRPLWTRLRAWIALAALAYGCTGCASSLSLARDAREAQAAGTPATSARCITLDAQHRWYGAIGKGAAVTAGGSGFATWPVTDDKAEAWLAAGALASAAVSAAAVYLSEQASASYVRECQ